MYARLALLAIQERYELQLLPYEKRDQFQIEEWLQHMDIGWQYCVSAQPISLSSADYVVRQWSNSKQRFSDIASARLALEKKLKALLATKVRWHNGKVTAQSIGSAQVLGDAGEAALVIETRLHHEASLLSAMVKGRKLLFSEMQALISEQKKAGGLSDWQTALQRSIVRREIIVSSSVQLYLLRKGKQQYRCTRCYEKSVERADRTCPYCGEACYYCKECIVMGRSRTCGLLLEGQYISPMLTSGKTQSKPPREIVQLGRYKLSPAQQRATKAALYYIYDQFSLTKITNKSNGVFENWLQLLRSWNQRYERNFLIWAVTGAGKTEMIFPLIEYVTKQGGKVLLATPRRDVVLELDPRLRKVFPELKITTLYGGSDQRWQAGQLVIATTHQLMRFQQAFELVIIDELDAFPYHGDPRLYRVAEQCSYNGGVRVLLSATPPRELQRAIRAQILSHVLLPVRYHRHPLPVPTMLTTPTVAEQLRKGTIPPSAIQAMKQSLDRGAQLFVFVQRIAEAEPYVALLQHYFANVVIAATSSKDNGRTERVQNFRARHIRILVTTTILERGVTIPQSDVYICDADGALFDEASLVQMAGRAGRSGDDPCGKVYFIAKHRNDAQLRAIKQIKKMNKLARQQKYLLEQYW